MGLFSGRRADVPEWQNQDPKIRRAAVSRLADPSLLSEVLRTDTDDEVKRRAQEALLGLALSGDAEAAQSALAALTDESSLIAAARQAPHEAVARTALARLSTPRAHAAVARQGSHLAVRMEAVQLLRDPQELGNVALKAEEKDVALAALEMLAGGPLTAETEESSRQEVLAAVAERARNKAAARRARTLLRGDEGAEAGQEKPRPTDRPRQKELCDAMEALARVEEPEGLQESIDRVRMEWIDLVPDVDADLEERFEAAWRAAKEHRVKRLQEEARRRELEAERAKEHTERVVPRLELIRRVESLQGQELEPGLQEARAEWEGLRVLETQEGDTLRERFEIACSQAGARQKAWQSEQGAARQREAKETARQEQERVENERLRRLEQICARGERLLASATPTTKAIGRVLREVRSTLESPGEFPSAKERSAWNRRLQAIQAALTPRLAELRESEGWKLWANEGVQEEICRLAESLAEVAEPAEAAGKLSELQVRWRQASTVSREKSQQLWSRFKEARDAVRSRLEATHAQQAAAKEAICQQAEALESSSDWRATAEAMKRLQSEWKAIGTAGAARDRALWLRFRGACDRFFTRRKVDLKQRRAEWAGNLKARIGLCEQAEAVADSSDWDATADLVKKLQKEWKSIGPVGGKDSEATWKRFREACDRYFQRYKRRHEIEQETRAARREELCARMEALGASEAGAAPEGLLESLRTLEKDWQGAPPLPPRLMPPWEARFHGALERVVAAFPAPLADTEYDAPQNRRRMEELLERVEKLMPGKDTVDATHLSPATRLAAMWVEAMAANTIGGKVAEDTQLRAAQEEVRRAQSAWTKIGHVPEEIRRDLTRRFQRACARIVPKPSESPAGPNPGAGATR